MSNRTRKYKSKPVYGNKKKSSSGSSEDSVIEEEDNTEKKEIGLLELINNAVFYPNQNNGILKSLRNAVLPPKVNNWVQKTLFHQKEEQHSEYSSFASLFISAHGLTSTNTYITNFQEFCKKQKYNASIQYSFKYDQVSMEDFVSLFDPEKNSLLFSSRQGRNAIMFRSFEDTKDEYTPLAHKLSTLYEMTKQLKQKIKDRNGIFSYDIHFTIQRYKLLRRIELLQTIHAFWKMYMQHLHLLYGYIQYLDANFDYDRNTLRQYSNHLALSSDEVLELVEYIENIIQSENYVHLTVLEKIETVVESIKMKSDNLYSIITTSRDENNDMFYIIEIQKIIQNARVTDPVLIKKNEKIYKYLQEEYVRPWITMGTPSIHRFLSQEMIQLNQFWREEIHSPNTADTDFSAKPSSTETIHQADMEYGINFLMAVKKGVNIQSSKKTRRRKKLTQIPQLKFSDNVQFTPALNRQQTLIDERLQKSGTKVQNDKRFRHIGFHKNFEFILNMFIDRHCHCEFSMTIKNNIKSYYTKIHKFNENMDVNDTYPPDNIFPQLLTDTRIKSRVIDFVFILREIEVIKKFQLSTLIFLFQYLIGIEFISFVIQSCRGYT